MLTRPQIIQAEIEFPREWVTHVVKRPWGLLYHTPEIPESHDGNHAHILRTADPAAALREITAFYTARAITPRLYHLSEPADPFSAQVHAAAAAHGFRFYVAANPTRNFIIERPIPTRPAPFPGMEIRRLTTPLPALAAMLDADPGPYLRKVTERCLVLPSHHILVGFLADAPVAFASLQQLPRLVRVADVFTTPAHRGQGIGRALIHHMVAYHAQYLTGPLWLYADNPIAIRLYLQAGFVETQPFDSWSAWLE